MKTIVTNAFSLNMLHSRPYRLTFTPVTVEQAVQYLDDWTSAVGHQDTAALFSQILGVTIPWNRVNVTIEEGTQLLVGQYQGPRLPEGASMLPDGATITWWLVR